ncbi:peptide deformylase [Fastidiosibacter lacustris]|uniref:peptide deformylase n=1 Tax=Fastidiosibacter lacustris TaxID=2056695 RepID=UPI000E34AF80|nr:peptide deformylase [Fastidiosibacter lacustris]
MAKLEILKYPHPFLKKRANPVSIDKIDNYLRITIANMFETMYENHGGGLAATQVGLNMRLFIMDGSENKDQKFVAINPEIIERKGEIYEEEGCLSFPGVSAKVKRAAWIKMRALNEFGEMYELECDGYHGRCIQHEIDHLDGITYFDHLSPLKRQMIEKKYKKLMQENSEK